MSAVNSMSMDGMRSISPIDATNDEKRVQQKTICKIINHLVSELSLTLADPSEDATTHVFLEKKAICENMKDLLRKFISLVDPPEYLLQIPLSPPPPPPLSQTPSPPPISLIPPAPVILEEERKHGSLSNDVKSPNRRKSLESSGSPPKQFKLPRRNPLFSRIVDKSVLKKVDSPNPPIPKPDPLASLKLFMAAMEARFHLNLYSEDDFDVKSSDEGKKAASTSLFVTSSSRRKSFGDVPNMTLEEETLEEENISVLDYV